MAANKQLQFIKGSVILIVSNLVLKGINFFLLPLYTKYLSPSELGISDTITSLTSVIFPLLVMGLDSAFSAFYYDQRNEEYQNKIFNTVTFSLAIASIVPVIIAFFSKYLSTFLFGSNGYGFLISVALVSVTMNLWYLPFSLLIRMQNRMVLFSIINIVASLTMIGLNILLLSVCHVGVYALIVSTAVVQGIQIILYLCFGKAKVHYKKSDKSLAKRMFKYALPLVPAILATWILNLSDRYLINYFCGESQVGLYGIAARFGTAISLFANGVYMAYTTYAYDKKDDNDAKQQYARILNAFVVLLLTVCLTVSFFGKEIIALMTESAYQCAYTMLIPLLFSQILYGINTIVGYALGFEKKSTYSFIATTAGAVINVVLNMIFIPQYGAVAAAYTTCFSFACMTAITYIFAQKLYYVRYRIVRMLLVLVITFFLTIFAQELVLTLRFVIWLGILCTIALIYKDVMADYIKLIKKVLFRREFA